VIECLKSSSGRLEKTEEYEFPEDSDCETESEPPSGSVVGNVKVDCEQKWGRKLLPVLKIGSLVA
jgi:hypothetical protein